ncbi:MAG: hypothetical protein P1V97_08765, partial [Planctomycetota bacterium]|nr:hypothetical protein [Planctomycetota bacterium]
AVLLADADAVLDKLVYTLLNAVNSNLVKHPSEWLGAKSSIQQIGTTSIVVKKPKLFFRGVSHLPAEERLRLTVPKQFSNLTPAQLQALISRELERRLEQKKCSNPNTDCNGNPDSRILDQPR